MPEGAVPGFNHDVFVSYAHDDNQIVGGAGIGFVGQLVKDLKAEVGRKIGKALKIWWDLNSLPPNIPVTPTIVAAAGDSASIVVIASPAYLKSKWCSRELLEHLGNRQSNASGSVFFVSIEPIPQKVLPKGLTDLIGYDFYRMLDDGCTARPLRTDLASDKEPYYNRLSQLAQNITDYLNSLLPPPSENPPPPPPPPREEACVLLLEVTDDLVQRRAELKDYLQQLGIVVLPEKRYSRDDMTLHREQMLTDLRRSRACVQILGSLSGDRGDHPRGMAWFRYETIRDSRETVPFLQWRDPDLDLASVKDQDASELLTPPSVRTDRAPDFWRAVSELALKPPAPAKPKWGPNARSVFVNFDMLDQDLGAEVAEWLQNDGFIVLPPPQSTENTREDWETNLRLCDGHVLLYAQTKPVWVRSQILLGNKINRENPPTLCVSVGPPPPDAGRDKVQDLGLRYNGIHYVNLLDAPPLNLSEMQKLAAKLREVRAP